MNICSLLFKFLILTISFVSIFLINNSPTPVFVNDIFVGSHLGGYLPFSFDITDYLENYSEKQKITLVAEDNLNHFFPYGKQKKNRGGMWYTPVSGIWQTVWMEIVPEIYISKIKILPDTKGFNLFVETTDTTECKNDELPLAKSDAANKNDFFFRVLINGKSGKTYTFDFSETDFRIDLIDSSLQTKDDFELWTCENPNLYDFSVSLFLSKDDLENQNAKDKIESYFGLREISILEIEGKNRICLNKKPVFLHGVLDQGYFVDGIYLPKSEEGFRKDIQKLLHTVTSYVSECSCRSSVISAIYPGSSLGVSRIIGFPASSGWFTMARKVSKPRLPCPMHACRSL